MGRAKKGFWIGLATVTLVLAAAGFALLTPIVPLPFFESLEQEKLDAVNGNVTVCCEGENRSLCLASRSTYVSLEETSPMLISAFVCVEDKRFYRHGGVDWIRTLGALKSNLAAGSRREGGSTITQQLVKNVYLSGEKSVKRKMNEIRLALEVNRVLSKQETMEKYLNILYFGDGIYGVEDASSAFFGKKSKDLRPHEIAVLVAVINNPSAYSPYEKPENCKRRRDFVLERMRESGLIDEKEYDESIRAPLCVKEKSTIFDQYDHFLLRQLKADEVHLKGKTVVVGCKDRRISEISNCVLSANTPACGRIGVMVTENATGKVLAHCATAPYDLSASRFLPGSLVKPVLCYAPLFEDNIATLCDPVKDEKLNGDGYCPANYANVYRGKITQAQALAYSSNVIALQNVRRIGLSKAVAFAQNTGLKFSESDFRHEAVALGGMQNGVGLQDIATSYTSIARGGERIDLTYWDSVYNQQGRTASKNARTKRVMREDTAFLLNRALRECAAYGTGKKLAYFDNVCAKTGTVGNDKGNRYAYCIAFSPQFTVFCYAFAEKELLPLSLTGGTLPTRVVADIFAQLDDKYDFSVPDCVKLRSIDMRKWEKENDVVSANETTPYKDRKEFWFSVHRLPKTYVSAQDFLLRYFPSDSDEFGIFDRFFD